MESKFKVPNVPLISTKDFYQTPGQSSKSSSSLTRGSSKKSGKSSSSSKNNINELNDDQSANSQTKLCLSCSKILLETLLPLETGFRNLFNLADPQVFSQLNDSIKSLLIQNSQPESKYSDQNSRSKQQEVSTTNNENIQLENLEIHSVTKFSNQQDPESSKINENNGTQFYNDQITKMKHEAITNFQPSTTVDSYSSTIDNGKGFTVETKDNNHNVNQLNELNQTIIKQSNGCQINEDKQENNNKIHTNDDDQVHANEHQLNSQDNLIIGPSTHQSDLIGVEQSSLNQFQGLKPSINSSEFLSGDSIKVKWEFNEKILSESKPCEPLIDNSSFAYVTIITNNLAAINAILLANSLVFYNNTQLVASNDKNQIEKRFKISLVALVSDLVDKELLSIIGKFYDQIIQLKPLSSALINNESLGIHHLKVHLWKELANQFVKCLYLDTNTLVTGQISNLFLECQELSACVDCFFPDYFNCSVILFEPSEITYKELINYGIQHRLNYESKDDIDDSIEQDTLDEITLLNEFFSSRWKKLSFIYNYVQNNSTYTQVSAYFKFGNNIRVVNFGNINTANTYNNNREKLSLEPWSYKFNLNTASLEEEPFKQHPIDEFRKFYLLLFIRRVWPLLSKRLTPIMLNQSNNADGSKKWSIKELAQIIARQSRTINYNFELNNSFTLKRLSRKKLSMKIENGRHIKSGDLSIKSMTQVDEDVPDPEQRQDTSWKAKNDNENDDRHSATSHQEKLEFQPVDNQNGDGVNTAKSGDGVDSINRQDWERGRIDWMHQHQSDKIIDRLMTKF